jgi:hypothetical protein
MYSFDNVNALPLHTWGTNHVLQTPPQAHLIISQFGGRGSCICQTGKDCPEVISGHLRTVKISKCIKCIHLTRLMHFHWMCLGFGLCPKDVTSSTSDHFPMLGKGELYLSNWKGSPWGEFWSAEDSQNNKIHLVYPSNNVNALPLGVLGLDHVLQMSPQPHLIISQCWEKGSCICQTWKGLPWG